MDCPACHHPNRASAKFCEECGQPFAASCGSCNTELRPGAKFCDECGTSTAPAQPVSTREPAERVPSEYTPRHLADKILQSKSALEGERKQVTVLFADVKSSMELAEQVDPERWHGILNRFFEILSEGVHRFEGTVNQYTGDGIMALFGAPIAHEDHAQRACYAALRLRDELRAYADELRLSEGLDFAARMGINSGEVVVGKIGDDLRMDYTAQGHTVGLAARMESMAPAHGVCISQSTADLASGYVSVRDLGESRIKGASDPVRVFELEGMGQILSRFDLSRARGLTRFVGRDDDMGVLEQAYEQAAAGNGQVVGVVAQAGTGKSRLCFEFAERCRARGLSVLQGTGVAHGKNIPFLPILQIFRQYFGIAEEDAARTAREKIAGRLLLIDEGFREFLPVMFDFMGVPDSDNPAPSMDPDARQRKLFNVMHRVVEHGEGARINLVEDLHWIDAGSEAWVEQMVDAASSSQTLLIVNFRPEYHAQWMQKPWYRQLPLLPLGPDAIQELLDDLLGSDPSVRGLATLVFERTAGNPFFAEEVVQTLIESGSLEGTKGSYRLTTPIQGLQVPDTVKSVLAARIDRLQEREKQALQAAAVIGKEFAEPILAAVLDWPNEALRSAMQTLKNGEFLYEQSLYPVTEYAFKHPLTQEVALGSQLQERRATTHGAVARAIEAGLDGDLDEQAALLAHHYEEAGDIEEAARCHRLAALWVIKSDASQSREHWHRFLELLGSLPTSPDRERMQLEAIELLVSNSWRFGEVGEEQRRTAEKGRAIAERLGDHSALCAIEYGYSVSLSCDGQVEPALGPARQAVEWSRTLDLETQMIALSVQFDVFWHAGQLRDAAEVRQQMEQLSVKDYDIGIERFGFGLWNWQTGRDGILAYLQGDPESARRSRDICLEYARTHGHEEVATWMLNWCGPWLDDITGVREHSLGLAQQSIELAERSGSPLSTTISRVTFGWTQLREGLAAEAVATLERALELHRVEKQGRMWTGVTTGLLAEAYLANGQPDAARQMSLEAPQKWSVTISLFVSLARARVLLALDGAEASSELEALFEEAERLIERGGAVAYTPLFREQRGRLARLAGDVEAAEGHLREALSLYRRYGAGGHAERLAAELGA
jgi:class 3 adenylate cyclase/tetratricopeptide (TPR) repeat protein